MIVGEPILIDTLSERLNVSPLLGDNVKVSGKDTSTILYTGSFDIVMESPGERSYCKRNDNTLLYSSAIKKLSMNPDTFISSNSFSDQIIGSELGILKWISSLTCKAATRLSSLITILFKVSTKKTTKKISYKYLLVKNYFFILNI